MATHVIQFRDEEKYKDGIMALLDVPVSRMGIPGLKMIVSEEHIQALKRANVEYTDITKWVGPNGEKAEPTCRSDASEAAIFGRIFADGRQALTPELARHILALEFNDEDKARMHELAVKNQEDRISAEELRDLDSYVKVADLVAILQSKARKLLRLRFTCSP